MFTAFILIFSGKHKLSFILPVLIIGVIPQIKIYSGILFYTGLSVIACLEFIKRRDLYFLKILFLSGIVSALVYLPINYGAGGLVFAPLRIYKNFIDSAWIFNNWHWNVNYIIYAEHGNYIHIAYFYLVSITLFVVTGLGARMFMLLSLKKILKKNFYTSQNIFWSVLIIFSFLIPSFFVQSVSSFSIIQFFWVGYIILLIPTAYALGSLLEKRGKIISIVLVAFLVLLFAPDLAKTLETYSKNPAVIESDLVKQASIIGKLQENDGIIAVNRVKIKGKYSDIHGSPLISAISGHSIYYEHELTEFQGLGEIISERRKNIDRIAENIEKCDNPKKSEDDIISIMRNTNNEYLLILTKNECTLSFQKLQVISEEGKYILFKI
jgi:hypothetical protein